MDESIQELSAQADVGNNTFHIADSSLLAANTLQTISGSLSSTDSFHYYKFTIPEYDIL